MEKLAKQRQGCRSDSPRTVRPKGGLWHVKAPAEAHLPPHNVFCHDCSKCGFSNPIVSYFTQYGILVLISCEIQTFCWHTLSAPVTMHNPSGCPMHVSSSFQIYITYPSRCPLHSWIQRLGCIQTPGSSLCTILVSGSFRILEKNYMNCDFNCSTFWCLVLTFLRTLGHTWGPPLSL